MKNHSFHINYEKNGKNKKHSQTENYLAKVIYTKSGIIELNTGNLQLISPYNYVIWVPANMPYTVHTNHPNGYICFYIENSFLLNPPKIPCLILQTTIIKALFEDFTLRRVSKIIDKWDTCQAEILLERIIQAERHESYLPCSKNSLLSNILQKISSNPGDSTTLKKWATILSCSERSLARLFQRDLGMSFTKWRNRARLLKAIKLLQNNHPPNEIAIELGYSTISAFRATFRKLLGITPEHYRNQQKKHQVNTRAVPRGKYKTMT